MNSWKPPVTLEEIQEVVDSLGMDKFVSVVKTALRFQVAYALKNLNGKTAHPNIYLGQKGHDLTLTVFVPDHVRVRSGRGDLWTKPLVLFRGEMVDFKDAAGDWHFKKMFSEASFREWMMSETRTWTEEEGSLRVAVLESRVWTEEEELIDDPSL